LFSINIQDCVSVLVSFGVGYGACGCGCVGVCDGSVGSGGMC